jgi:eukaryotic-like serine/threonine-protein kinase
LLSAPVAAAVTAVLYLIGSSYQNRPMSVEQLSWVFTVGLVGAWTVLIPAKLWEGAAGDQTLRRFMMMVLGLGLGVLACGLAQYLLIADLPGNSHLSFWHPGWAARWFYSENGRPLWPAFAAAFGSLFLLIRWWRLADPLRTARFSLGALILVVILAFLAADAWDFPQPWLPRIATVVAVSVLLSGRWVHPHQRTHPRL